MASDNSYLKQFSTRVRQLILQYKAVKKENDDLYQLVDERDRKIAELQEENKRLKNEYQALKVAKMLEVTDNDLDNAKKRISALIRNVNQCITLLSEKQ